MTLLCFAHRLEAEAFFIHMNFVPIQGQNSLYRDESKQFFLLITGEGVYKAISRVTSVLTRYKEIKKILNLGVIGGLKNNLKTFDLYSVRTSYHSQGKKPEAITKSFDLNPIANMPFIDLISSSCRIKEFNQKKYLGYFADGVDMELWGVCFAASSYNLPVQSLKIVADEFTSESFCLDIKQDAIKYGNLLFNHFLELKKEIDVKVSEKEQIVFERVVSNTSFYFTTSQKRLIFKLIKRHDLNLSELETLLGKVDQSNKNKKLNSKSLISALSNYGPTYLDELSAEAKDLLKPLKSVGLGVAYDQNYECDQLEFSLKPKNQQDFEVAVNALSEFKIDSWKRFINGSTKDV